MMVQLDRWMPAIVAELGFMGVWYLTDLNKEYLRIFSTGLEDSRAASLFRDLRHD